MKIVINCQYGGYQLSEEIIRWVFQLRKKQDINCGYHWEATWAEGESSLQYYYCGERIDPHEHIARNDPDLVRVVEHIKPPHLKVVTIPDDVDWEICEYDGSEWVAEKHRRWY